MAEKVYLNGFFVRARDTQYGEVLNCSISVAQFNEFAKEHAKDGYVKVTISERKTPSPKGITHSVALDTYEPKGRQAPQPHNPPANAQPPMPDDDVPF